MMHSIILEIEHFQKMFYKRIVKFEMAYFKVILVILIALYLIML